MTKDILLLKFDNNNILIDSKKGTNILKGIIINQSNSPISFVSIYAPEIKQWAFTNSKGEFTLTELPQGELTLEISCLGYASKKQIMLIKEGINNTKILLNQSTFALPDVTVMAKQSKQETNTTYSINQDAIEHAQASDLAEIMSLLPGGQTISSNLTSGSRTLKIRSGETYEEDNPSFGTAIEINGIRLSNNANFTETKGFDTRIIPTNNIAKIKVITGVPSVEYGDLTSGLINIITKKGVMPFNLKFSSSPKNKQISIGKGFKASKKTNAGIINLNYNHTKSISNIASPYTNYIRNAFSTNYNIIFKEKSGKPIVFNTQLAGNIGGYDSKKDPDSFNKEYKKKNAFNLRGGINVKWKTKTKLISDIDFSANANFSNQTFEENKFKSSAASSIAIHGTQEGYFISKEYKEGHPFDEVQILPRGHWFQKKIIDQKPINYNAKLKIHKINTFKNIKNNLLIGANYSGSGNFGKGLYYEDKKYTPSWHEHKYSEEPFLNNTAFFIEENIKYQINKHQSIILIAGLRNDFTKVKDSRYSNVNALSPRFNLRYNILTKKFNKLSIYGGWGKSVKLPSFDILYTPQGYSYKLALVTPTDANGNSFSAYYINPERVLKNKDLNWQYNRLFEIGIQGKFKNINFSLSYYNSINKGFYTETKSYNTFTYKQTTPRNLAGITIPFDNRKYSINQNGIVTVSDKTGNLPDQKAPYNEKYSFNDAYFANNGSPMMRHGLEWVINSAQIKALHTSLRIDGKYYYYKYINKLMGVKTMYGNQLMHDRKPYKYLGYYYGGSGVSNGKEYKQINANATFITHIPKIRLVFTLKIESSLYSWEQMLSEMPNGKRGFVLNKKEDYTPSEKDQSIYDGNHFVGLYPMYYTTFDDMYTKVPFKEKFLWAKENDINLYNDLTKLVVTSNTDYYFKEKTVTPYWSANINISKEIGKHAKVTFYAKNFLNNMAKVKSSDDNINRSLLNSLYIVPFNYGISLNIIL